MKKISLRWNLSPYTTYKFNVSETTTIGEVCNLVIDHNNKWPGNPTFSVVKIYGDNNKFVPDNSTMLEMCIDNDDCLIFAAG
jgi:hypothetical protein